MRHAVHHNGKLLPKGLVAQNGSYYPDLNQCVCHGYVPMNRKGAGRKESNVYWPNGSAGAKGILSQAINSSLSDPEDEK